MSADTFTHIIELEPDVYQVLWGMGEEQGRQIYLTNTLKAAIKKARDEGAEYGPYFAFLDDEHDTHGTSN